MTESKKRTRTRAERQAGDAESALERVLSHAESHGEAYDGATEDHATLRAAIADAKIPGDRRGLDDKPLPDTPKTGAESGQGAPEGAGTVQA